MIHEVTSAICASNCMLWVRKNVNSKLSTQFRANYTCNSIWHKQYNARVEIVYYMKSTFGGYTLTNRVVIMSGWDSQKSWFCVFRGILTGLAHLRLFECWVLTTNYFWALVLTEFTRLWSKIWSKWSKTIFYIIQWRATHRRAICARFTPDNSCHKYWFWFQQL